MPIFVSHMGEISGTCGCVGWGCSKSDPRSKVCRPRNFIQNLSATFSSYV